MRENTIGTKLTLDGSQAKKEVKETEAALVKLEKQASKPLRIMPSVASSFHDYGITKAATAISSMARTSAIASPPVISMASVTRSPFSGVGGVAGGIGGGVVSAMTLGAGIGNSIISALPMVGKLGGALFSVASTFGSMFMDFLGKGLDLLMGIPKMLAGGFLAAGVTVAGGLYASHKALGPAAEMERYKSQLDFMGKPELLGFYKNLAQKSPLSLNETVSGGILAENFQLDSTKYLPLATDMASAFKVPLEEILRAFGYLKSGRTGEGMESLRRFGISNEALEKLGTKFEKSGEVAEKSKSGILDAVYTLASGRFAGMAEKQSGTYEGKISNLGDAIFQAMADGFKNALPYATQAVQVVTGAIGELGAKLSTVDWSGFGSSLVNLATKAADVVKSVDLTGMLDSLTKAAEKASDIAAYLFTAEGWANLTNALMDSWDKMKSSFSGVWQTTSVALYETLKLGGDYFGLAMEKGFNSILNNIPTAMSLVISSILQVFTEAGRILDSSIKAVMLKVIPDSLLSPQQRQLKSEGFVASVSADLMARSIANPTWFEKTIGGMFNEMERKRMDLGIREGDVKGAWEKVLTTTINAVGNNLSPVRGFSQNASKNAEGKEKIEQAWEDFGPTMKQLLSGIEDVKQVGTAGNVINSQMLREMRDWNEYNMTELNEAYLA